MAARNRSLGGCSTCRRKHVKCDEERPTCSTCARYGRVCEGYPQAIFFESDIADSTELSRFRRPLFTEDQRRCMSELLTSTITPRWALWHLEQIDEACEVLTASEEVQINHGPFGAFRVLDTSGKDPDRTASEVSEDFDDSFQVIGTGLEYNGLDVDISCLPSIDEFLQSLFMTPDNQQSIPSNLDSFDLMLDSERVQELFDYDPGRSLPDMRPLSHTMVSPAFAQVASNQVSGKDDGYPRISRPPSPLSAVDSSLLSDAVVLIKHYSSTVIGVLTPFRHTKTPWHVLFNPHLKNCLATLTLGESLDHASLCAFLGCLSLSAFSLGGIYKDRNWIEKAKGCRQGARQQAKEMIKSAYAMPKIVKYKAILIGLLVMVQLSTFSSSQTEREYYFVETEKFIRLRGLAKRKSRKVRLLHHCYVFERLFYESTLVHGASLDQRLQLCNVVDSSEVAVYSVDSPTFFLPNWDDLNAEMTRVKSQEEGENDLHLSRIGTFTATMYPEIFGVPEPWLLLLSLIIRLGKEKDAAEQHYGPTNLGLKDFLKRARNIERYIHQCKPESHVPELYTGQHSTPELQRLRTMLKAMHHAMIIYFYRRIYDVQASVLQKDVVAVRDCLQVCESGDAEAFYGSAAFTWSAFIAASEAEGADVRQSFTGWYQSAEQRTGLSSFTESLKLIESVWRENSIGTGDSLTWLEILKHRTAIELVQRSSSTFWLDNDVM